MNRFVKSGSPLLQAVIWIFAVTLFADAANLDDLCSGTIVLHDDDEVVTPDLLSFDGISDQVWRDFASSGAAHQIRQAAQFPRTPVRIVVDQDSPSLPADALPVAFRSTSLPDDSPAVTPGIQPATEHLHLRFHALLI